MELVKADPPKNSILRVRKNKSKGRCWFAVLYWGKPTKRGEAVGKTGWQRGWQICSPWSIDVVSVLLKVMSFYKKWATAREDFLAGDREERPQPALLLQSRRKYRMLPAYTIQKSTHASSFYWGAKQIFLIWQSTLIHCFISDDANGIINGGFSQLTCWCERAEWLYYSAVLCSDFLCSCKTGPLYSPPLVIYLSSFFILKADWNSKESVYSEPCKISQARAFKATVLLVVFWRDAAAGCGAVLFYRT